MKNIIVKTILLSTVLGCVPYSMAHINKQNKMSYLVIRTRDLELQEMLIQAQRQARQELRVKRAVDVVCANVETVRANFESYKNKFNYESLTEWNGFHKRLKPLNKALRGIEEDFNHLLGLTNRSSMQYLIRIYKASAQDFRKEILTVELDFLQKTFKGEFSRGDDLDDQLLICGKYLAFSNQIKNYFGEISEEFEVLEQNLLELESIIFYNIEKDYFDTYKKAFKDATMSKGSLLKKLEYSLDSCETGGAVHESVQNRMDALIQSLKLLIEEIKQA